MTKYMPKKNKCHFDKKSDMLFFKEEEKKKKL